METEVSFAARFFGKFIEITAAGLATALSAYLIAHLGGLLTSVTPAPAAVQAGPAAAAKSHPAAPVAAAADDQRPTPPSDTDASTAQAARKAAKAVPPRQDIKTGTSVARSDRSVEALARAALADADQPAPAAAPPRQADVQPPLAPVQVLPQPAPVQVQPEPVIVADPLPPRGAGPDDISAPVPQPPPAQGNGLFAVLKRMPDLLRPDPPASVGEAIRPPMPIGTAAGQ
jgi:hypothetical protein